MTYGNGPVTLIWLEWFDPLFKDYIQINPEKTFIRIVANTQSGSNSFQDLLRLFIQYSDNQILITQWGYRLTYHWSYPLENSAKWTGQRWFDKNSVNLQISLSMTNSSKSSTSSVLKTVANLGLPHKVIEIDPALADTALFCEHYGFPMEQSWNTIIVASKRNQRYL